MAVLKNMVCLARPMACLVAILCLMLGGCGIPSFLITPVSGSQELQEEVVQPGKGWSPKKIVILEVEGMLINARQGGFLQATENDVSRFAQQLDKAAADGSVAALILRVNTPGGTVTTSDTMYNMVRKWKQKTGKPVLAHTQEVAASGGYYVCCAADKIVAHPTSLIGSIGVIFQTFDFSGTMGMIGMRATSIKSGPLKDMGSPLKPLEAKEQKVLQAMIDEFFERFVSVVRKNRNLSEQPVPIVDYKKLEYDGIFSGRVFSGETAVRLGLADQTGSLEETIELARAMTRQPGAAAVLYKRPYGYSGSIYASQPTPPPQPSVIQLKLPESRAFLPTGFYYLWEP
mgnify:CR=1 FL=1